MIRRLIGLLANLTPNTVYMSQPWRVRVRDGIRLLRSVEDGRSTPLGVAATAWAVAASDVMEPGDELEATLTGVESGGRHLGDYVVTVRRVS